MNRVVHFEIHAQDEEESEIKRRADEFARSHKKLIAKKATEVSRFPPDEFPVSVFMAGSPGAGKTESSTNLIYRLTQDGHPILRIDPDELRMEFPEYTGTNSHLFIGATSIIADKIHDFALSHKQSFVFDGTLSHIVQARNNVERSLLKGRLVQIVYVYQVPLQAWNFVQAREKQDGRKIPREAFIDAYFNARETVNALKKEFGSKIKVDLVVKNIDGTDFSYRENIDLVDNYIPERYTKSDLEILLIV